MKSRLLLLLALFAVVMVSCRSEKDKYIDQHRHFAESFLEEYQTYTSSDWDAADRKYSQLKEQYADLMLDMSREERQAVDELNGKIDAAFLQHQVDNIATRFESIIQEGATIIQELLK